MRKYSMTNRIFLTLRPSVFQRGKLVTVLYEFHSVEYVKKLFDKYPEFDPRMSFTLADMIIERAAIRNPYYDWEPCGKFIITVKRQEGL